MKHKKLFRSVTALLAALVLMGGFSVTAARKSGNRKAAHDNQCGKQYGKLSDYLFILHCRCPPVRRGKWLPAAAR